MTSPPTADQAAWWIAERRPTHDEPARLDPPDHRTLRRGARAARRATARADRTARWAARRTRTATATAAFARAARPVLPLLLVTGFAGVGQVLWALHNIAPPEWSPTVRLGMAIGAAAAVESIALNVQWHAHDAHVHGRLSSAARLRRASYAIAALVAAINYAHFAADGGAPTPAAVMFALFSASSPWLWGLHTRRVREIHLAESGARVDLAGAEFAPIRWRLFPLRTLGAWRWSVDHGVTDPAAAWAGYSAHRAATRDQRRRAADAPTEPAPELVRHDDPPTPVAPPAEPTPPARAAAVALATVPPPPVVRADTQPRPARPARTARTRRSARRPGGPARTDTDVLAAADDYAATHGPITSRDAFRKATGTGGDRSVRLFDLYQRQEATR